MDVHEMKPERIASFGALLQSLRKAAGLTQEELAEKAGLTAKAISALERGERKRPYPHTVRSIADALCLPDEERVSLLASVPKRDSEASSAAPSPEAVSANLPNPSTALLGREGEVAEIFELLGEARLLTLTGMGGVGKTRLAIEAARKASGLFPDGSAFVGLASVGDAALVLPSIVKSLGMREAAGRMPVEAACAYLRGRRFLLVLDNLEHVLEAAPEMAELMEHCPDLTLLATSRAPLRLRGETEYPVEPLSLPGSTRNPEAGEILASASGRLFVERARSAFPGFEVTGGNASAVASICWRLSGIPLALELAATKVRHLDPETLLSRLDRALSAGWARDLPERQRTMRATLDWSHALLHAPEKELFRRLSVFSGGWTLEAAEAAGERPEEVFDLLGNLVEQSLVAVRRGPEGARFTMLEPVRQYAFEKLEESGEANEAESRHVAFFLGLAERAGPGIRGRDQVSWLDRLEAENDNLRAAVGRSLETDDPGTAARFGWALGMYWVMRARRDEARPWMERTVAREDLPERTRARALWALAACVYGSADAERHMAISEEGAALFRRVGDGHGVAYALGMVGFAALRLGDLDRAERVLEEALEGFRKHEDEWGAAHILDHLAVAPMKRGEYERAAGYAEEALELSGRTGDRLAGNIALHLLAQSAWGMGDHSEAARRFREALAFASEASDVTNSANAIQGLAAVAAAKNEPRRVARLLGAAEKLLEAAGVPVYATAAPDLHRRAASDSRESLGEEAWTRAWDEGRAMTAERAIGYALDPEKRNDAAPTTRRRREDPPPSESH